MESVIEKAVLDATGASPQKKNEDRQKYLIRLIGAVQKLSDDVWESLAETEGAQEHLNEMIELDNDGKAVPDFPDIEDDDPADDDGEEADDAEEEDDEEEERKAPAKKKAAAKKAPAKKAAAKKAPAKKAESDKKAPAKKAPAKSGGGGRKDGMCRTLKRIVVKKPTRAVDDLIADLEKKGFDAPSRLTVGTIRADTRDTIRVLNDAGITDIEL